ncbi:MAG: hypothetical protein R3C40_08910 [Parvularculaceae bacterium]|nr:hypothetical protein [Parvularculaceae bacterium]
MSAQWLNTLAESPWATAISAFVFGVCCGWLIGARAGGMGAKSNGELGKTADDPRLSAMQEELAAARTLLDDPVEDAADISYHVNELDDSINRANGRLKRLAAAVKKARASD